MNSCQLIGRVGKDAELRNVGDAQVLTFSLATSERWTASNGEKKERTSWHAVEYWGNGAKVLQEFITKGRELAVDGSIRYEEWEKEGQKHSRTKIRAHRLHLIGGKPKSQEERSDREAGSDDEVPF